MTSAPPSYRLSSRLTVPVRIFYVGFVVALAVVSLVAINDGTLGELSAATRVVLSAGALGGVGIVARLFRFVSVRLDDWDLRVQGLWREWRVPASDVTEVVQSDADGFAIVRVTLAKGVPGLGRRFHFLPPMLSGQVDSPAELIEVASRARSR